MNDFIDPRADSARLHTQKKVDSGAKLRTKILAAGQLVGQLTLLDRIPGSAGVHDRWRCRCSCGNEALVRSSSLVSVNGKTKTKSCGCARRVKGADTRQMVSQRWTIRTHEALTHLARLWRVDSTRAAELAIQYLGDMAASPDTTPKWLEIIPSATTPTPAPSSASSLRSGR